MLQTEDIMLHLIWCMCKDAHSTAFSMVCGNDHFQAAREEIAMLRDEEMPETTAASGVLEHVIGAAPFCACAC